MCGRYTLTNPKRLVAEFSPKKVEADLSRPRYNVAPTQNVPTIVLPGGKRVIKDFRWGLFPPWAENPSIGNRLINARAETVATKPAFRSAFIKRRCLILADGFYEWQKVEHGKQPMYVRVDGGRPFAFAGLYEVWHPGAEDETITCTIITTEPNELMRAIHNRMPVILAEQFHERWLDPDLTDRGELQAMLRPFDASRMDAYTVSSWVNSPTQDDARCIEQIRQRSEQ
jgi:putative SOS response-associated peptidase YedK